MNLSPIIETLPILILVPHNRCNCRCVMCDIWKLDTIEEIRFEDLERHRSDIERLRVGWVVFSGGEPLMHSDLFRLSRSLRQSGIRTTLLSTGLLLGKNAASVVDALDEVIVSLDGPPEVHDRIRRVARAYELLASGIAAIRNLRGNFPISARCTVQKANCSSLVETIATARGLNLNSISFLAADLTSEAFNRPGSWTQDRQSEIALNEDEIGILDNEVERLVEESRRIPGFVLETPKKLRKIPRHFRAQLGLVPYEAPRCNAPWVSAVLESNGTLRPCFFHAPIGDSNAQTFYDALNGPQAIDFRSSLHVTTDPICQRCVCSLYLENGVELGDETQARKRGTTTGPKFSVKT